MRWLVCLTALALSSLTLPANAAGAIKTLPVKSTSPADGAGIAPAPTSDLVLKSDEDANTVAWVEVATQPTLGQDGTLASEFTVDFTSALQGDAFPDTYTAKTFGRWSSQPGTYYWQMSFSRVDRVPDPAGSPYPSSELNTYISPVFKVTVEAPAPAPPPPADGGGGSTTGSGGFLSLASAKATAKRVIRSETGRRVYRLKRQCDRIDRTEVSCAVTWDTGGSRGLKRWWIYSGELDIVDSAEESTYSFDGVRANRACLKRYSSIRKGVKRCSRRVRW